MARTAVFFPQEESGSRGNHSQHMHACMPDYNSALYRLICTAIFLLQQKRLAPSPPLHNQSATQRARLPSKPAGEASRPGPPLQLPTIMHGPLDHYPVTLHG